jgi:2-phospho-L-lactate guanylyltransferase (CobY/MobA/RfbA family)
MKYRDMPEEERRKMAVDMLRCVVAAAERAGCDMLALVLIACDDERTQDPLVVTNCANHQPLVPLVGRAARKMAENPGEIVE